MDYEHIIKEAASRAANAVRSDINALKLNDVKQDLNIVHVEHTVDELKQTVEKMTEGNRKIMAFGVAIFLLMQAAQMAWGFFKG